MKLCSSRYAVEEARENLDEAAQKRRLEKLVRGLELFEVAGTELPSRVSLPEKDVPILLAAMEARATHLITGDMRDFGAYFGTRVEGILIVQPAEYLRRR